MTEATKRAETGLQHVQALNAALVDLIDALDQAKIHIEVLLATESGHAYNPECSVMLQLSDARRLAKFRSFTGGAAVVAEGPDALALSLATH